MGRGQAGIPSRGIPPKIQKGTDIRWPGCERTPYLRLGDEVPIPKPGPARGQFPSCLAGATTHLADLLGGQCDDAIDDRTQIVDTDQDRVDAVPEYLVVEVR